MKYEADAAGEEDYVAGVCEAARHAFIALSPPDSSGAPKPVSCFFISYATPVIIAAIAARYHFDGRRFHIYATLLHYAYSARQQRSENTAISDNIPFSIFTAATYAIFATLFSRVHAERVSLRPGHERGRELASQLS